MTISSINFQRVRGDKKQALDHIARTTEKEPVYLLEKSERKPNGFELLADVDKLHEEQMSLRKKNHSRGKAPELNDSLWEAVINLEEHHTMDDVKKVADFIHKKYHLTPTAIAIHRDEGYKDKTTGETKYNYHAHVMFYTVENGKSQMRTIGKKALSEMQTEVANLLHMERGQVNSKTVRLNHRQYREKAKELAEKDELYEKELYSLEQALDTAHDRDLETQEELLTLKEQKAIVEAERKKYKEEADHIVSEYRALQALNKTLHTKKELDDALAALRTQYEDRLAKEVEKTNTLNSTVNGLKAQKDYFEKAYNAELEVHQQLQQENKELRAELEAVKKERDYLSEFNSAVLQVIKAMHSEFDLEHPVQSLKKIYIAWKSQSQKSTETTQKRSQSDEMIVERVDVHKQAQSQSMSKFETSQPKEKFYTIEIGRQSYDMTAEQIRAEAQSDDVGHFTSEEFKKALTADEFREVFGEPQQVPQKKQSLFARVKHSLER